MPDVGLTVTDPPVGVPEQATRGKVKLTFGLDVDLVPLPVGAVVSPFQY